MTPVLNSRLSLKQICSYCVRVTFTAAAAAAFLYWASSVYSDEFYADPVSPAKAAQGYVRKQMLPEIRVPYTPESFSTQASDAVPTFEQFSRPTKTPCSKSNVQKTHNGR